MRVLSSRPRHVTASDVMLLLCSRFLNKQVSKRLQSEFGLDKSVADDLVTEFRSAAKSAHSPSDRSALRKRIGVKLERVHRQPEEQPEKPKGTEKPNSA